MKVLEEPGVSIRSERYFATPSSLAKKLFLYITRCGHYYCDSQFIFLDSFDVGKEESHKNYLLDYVRNGTLYAEADGKEFTIETGQIALTDCRKPHRFYAKDHVERIWLHFDGANAQDFFEQIIAFHNGKQAFTPYPESHVEKSMTELVAKLRDGNYMEADISKKLYALLCNLLIPPISETSDPSNPIQTALTYMNTHLFEELSVEDIAAHVGLSPSHFSRQFRSRTGFSPHEYLVLHRIDEAKALLHSTDLSVKEIAFRTGYHSEVNFITSFTRKVGVSPAAFRRT